MDYIIYDENMEATVVESKKEEDLKKERDARIEKYQAALKEAARK